MADKIIRLAGEPVVDFKATDLGDGTYALATAGDSTTSRVSLDDIQVALRYITNLLARPIWMEPGTGRLKVSLEAAAATLAAVTTVTTVTTVGTVTNMSQLGGYDAKLGITNAIERTLWANAIRARIS